MRKGWKKGNLLPHLGVIVSSLPTGRDIPAHTSPSPVRGEVRREHGRRGRPGPQAGLHKWAREDARDQAADPGLH